MPEEDTTTNASADQCLEALIQIATSLINIEEQNKQMLIQLTKIKTFIGGAD